MAKGKNFSMNNQGQRHAKDLYETPYSLTRLFLNAEAVLGNFSKFLTVLEPACGAGAIVKVLKEMHYPIVTSYDEETDFLKETRRFPQIITNPPYSKAFQFILKSKEVSDRFAFLLPLGYLHGQQRYEKIYKDADFPLRRVYVFTRYPMLGDPLFEDGKFRTGMQVYAWYVWERCPVGIASPPTLHHLDNNAYVLTAAEARDRGLYAAKGRRHARTE